MATILKFEELEIWKLSRQLSKNIFEIILETGLSRDFALRDQMNGSSGSIMDNIAEGFGRTGRLEFIQFLSFSTGSADELKSQLYRCFDRGYINEEKFNTLYNETNILSKKIHGFIKYLNSTNIAGTKFKNRVKNNKAENSK